MAIFSCHLSMVRRSGGESSVAGAAYNARDAMWDEYLGRTQSFVHAHSHERIVADLGVLVPDDAPEAWRANPAMPDDAMGRRACHEARLAVWNAAEAAETNANAQPARRIMVALPDELSTAQSIRLGLRIMEYFSAQGMVIDGVIHEDVVPNSFGHINRHFHGQMPTRACNAEGFASLKRRNAYAVRDAEGREAVLLPEELRAEAEAGHAWEKTYRYDLKVNGKRVASAILTPTEANLPQWSEYERRNRYPITEKREVVSWNEHDNAEKWRAGVADLINDALREANIDARVDHRSYERQGLDRAPQLHEGGAVVALERLAKAKADAKGVEYVPVTEVRRQNLEIQAINEARELDERIQSYRDEVSRVIEEIVPDGSEMNASYEQAEARAAALQTTRSIQQFYGGRLDGGSLLAWSDRMDQIAREHNLESSAPDDGTLLVRFELGARRAIAWATRVHARGDEALSHLVGAWGDAWTTVRRVLERTSAITRSALASPAASVRDVLAPVRRAVGRWVDEHRSVVGSDRGGSPSSSSSAPSSAEAPSRGIAR